MSNVVVCAAALRMGGAITIYNQFIDHLRDEIGQNKYFIFVNDNLQRPSIPGVQYKVVDVASWVRRNKFDRMGCAKILRSHNFIPDFVISLQNLGVHCLKNLPHLIYYHQSLPFFSNRWNPFNRAERTLFFYKHFYLFFLRHSIGKKVQFVVQTSFIKDNLVKRLGIDQNYVHVCFPDVIPAEPLSIDGYPFPSNKFNIIYPSLYSPHKSHWVVIEALAELKRKSWSKFENIILYFTITEKEAPSLTNLIATKGLERNVCLLGRLPHDEVLSLYRSANLMVFPSTIETLGLPLIEAASFGVPIIAADVPNTREVLSAYEGANYIEPETPLSWARAIEEFYDRGAFRYSGFCPINKGWSDFFKLIQ